MESLESLRISLETITTQMQAHLAEEGETEEEEGNFLNHIVTSLEELQQRLQKDRRHLEEEDEEKQQRSVEMYHSLRQQSEILHQQNCELSRLVKSQEESNTQLTCLLANNQLDNYQKSKIIHVLDQQIADQIEENKKGDEMSIANQQLQCRIMDLQKEEQDSISQMKEQTLLIQQLHQQHMSLGMECATGETKVDTVKREQEKEIQMNALSYSQILLMSQRSRQLVQTNEQLIAERDELQRDIEEMLCHDDIVCSMKTQSTNCSRIICTHEVQQRASQDNFKSVMVCLRDDVSDHAFSDNFFTPFHSLNQIDSPIKEWCNERSYSLWNLLQYNNSNCNQENLINNVDIQNICHEMVNQITFVPLRRLNSSSSSSIVS